ncbi:unnamed protein product, partial [Clavelina lepadiformis]
LATGSDRPLNTPAKHGRPREQHYICPSCPTPTEIDSASIRTRARIRSHDCLLPHSSHRILHRHGTPERPRDRATSRPDLEFGKVRGRLPWPPNRAPAGHCAQLERLDSENISQRLDFNFLSRLEKISESKHRPAAKNFSEVEKSALGQENMRGLGVWTLTFFGVDGKNFQSPKHRPARDALPSSENPRQVKAMRATWSFGL